MHTRHPNQTIKQKITCTDCRPEDYQNDTRIKELLALLKEHTCQLSMGHCECVAIAQELSELGYRPEFIAVTEEL